MLLECKDQRFHQKSRPDRDKHQPHQSAWIPLTEKLAVKTDHAPVLVPFHENRTIHAASALDVGHDDIGHEQNSVSRLLKAHTPIEVLAVQKIALI